MLRHIERLREKPEHVRKNIAFLTALGITLLIFGFWIASLTITSGPSSDNQASIQSPATSLTASVSGMYNYLKDLVTGGNKASYSTDNSVQVTPGDK